MSLVLAFYLVFHPMRHGPALRPPATAERFVEPHHGPALRPAGERR